jgi:hypothetical protein
MRDQLWLRSAQGKNALQIEHQEKVFDQGGGLTQYKVENRPLLTYFQAEKRIPYQPPLAVIVSSLNNSIDLMELLESGFSQDHRQ